MRADPFHCATDCGTNPAPVTASDTPVPTKTVVGLADVAVGAGLLIVNAKFEEVPPPGAGLMTETWAVPPLATSAAVMAACTCVPVTYVVVRADPFHCTTDVERKPVPVRVMDPPLLPATKVLGFAVVNAGVGLLVVNVRTEDVPPPGDGLTMESCPVPAVDTSAAVRLACSSVALTYVVARADPFHCTME